MNRVTALWLTAALLAAACAAPEAPGVRAPATPAPSAISPYASAADRICRGYAGRQEGQSADLMYDQCMFARGYLVPGFSPSPNTPGYQGPLLGPGAIGGGH